LPGTLCACATTGERIDLLNGLDFCARERIHIQGGVGGVWNFVRVRDYFTWNFLCVRAYLCARACAPARLLALGGGAGGLADQPRHATRHDWRMARHSGKLSLATSATVRGIDGAGLASRLTRQQRKTKPPTRAGRQPCPKQEWSNTNGKQQHTNDR